MGSSGHTCLTRFPFYPPAVSGVTPTMNRRRAEEKPSLLPIMHPLYNMREVCKQTALLEDHLNNERKRCTDCIRKHFLTIEALLEEAVSLDNKAKWADLLDGKVEIVRECQERWVDGEEPCDIAQDLRVIRKELTPECFDLRDMTSESRLAGTRKSPLRAQVAERYYLRRAHFCN